MPRNIRYTNWLLTVTYFAFESVVPSPRQRGCACQLKQVGLLRSMRLQTPWVLCPTAHMMIWTLLLSPCTIVLVSMKEDKSKF